MNVNVSYDPDHYQIPQPSPYVSFIDLGRQERSQLRGPGFDEDLESAREINLTARPLPRTY